MERSITTIQISITIRERLKALGRKGDTYEDIIVRLLEKPQKEGD